MPSLTYLPSEEELASFDATYAGPYTGELEKRYAELRERNSDPAYANYGDEVSPVHDGHCLVCLQRINEYRFLDCGKPYRIWRCSACTRLMHEKCVLKTNAEPIYEDDYEYCVLCQNRGWHIINRLADLSATFEGDALRMARANRMADWGKVYGNHRTATQSSKAKDDGSIECDRALLVSLGYVQLAETTTHVAAEGTRDKKRKREDSPAHSDNARAVTSTNMDSNLETNEGQQRGLQNTSTD